MSINTNAFGIPVTKGKLLSKTEHGFVVSFNLENLLIQKLIGGQLFSKDQQPLTLMVSPSSLPSLFQYPLILNSPDLAMAQKESSIIVFIKSPKFKFSEDLRIVFWFHRHPRELINDDDLVDVPDQYVPLLIALAAKEAYLHIGKPVPEDIEQEIKEITAEMEKEGNIQNYYLEDTFNLTQENLEKLSKDDARKLIEWKRSKKEFCHLVNDEYDKHRDKYSNRREAVTTNFNKYSFKDKKWTKEKCYNLCLQLARN